MLDKHVLPLIQQRLVPVVDYLEKREMSANQVTVISFLIGMIAVILIAMNAYFIGLLLILINRMGDGVDGMLARRQQQPSDAGAFLDICLDFIFYQAVVAGFILSDAQFAFWGSLMMLAFVGTGVSFLAFAIFSEKHQFQRVDYPHKGIYYVSGLTEGTETIGFFCLICLFPDFFNSFCIVFIPLCVFTAITRIYFGYQQLAKLKHEDHD